MRTTSEIEPAAQCFVDKAHNARCDGADKRTKAGDLKGFNQVDFNLANMLKSVFGVRGDWDTD